MPTLDQTLNPRRVVAHFDFNTGRLYTEQGQQISVTAYSDGLVYFNDHSRMIDGVFSSDVVLRLAAHPSSTENYPAIERVVVNRYDNNRYENGSVEDYDRRMKVARCGHFSIKRDSTTNPNFLCLDCGTLLSAESVYEASMATLRSVK